MLFKIGPLVIAWYEGCLCVALETRRRSWDLVISREGWSIAEVPSEGG